MADFPQVGVAPLFVNTWMRFGALEELTRAWGGGSLASLTWPVADTAFYVPISLPWPFNVRRMFWINGSDVTTVNMDIGIYTAGGVRLYSSGSTAQSGASTAQYVTLGTDILLTPGTYYLALACSSTTANRGGTGITSTYTTVNMRLCGVLQQATALPLPATMTGAAVANVCMPFIGITSTTTGF